jgi:hypothetical protein
VDDIIHPCTHQLLFCREILPGADHEWANLVDIANIQGLNPFAVHNLVAWKQGSYVTTFHDAVVLKNCTQTGLLFVHFSVLN